MIKESIFVNKKLQFSKLKNDAKYIINNMGTYKYYIADMMFNFEYNTDKMMDEFLKMSKFYDESMIDYGPVSYFLSKIINDTNSITRISYLMKSNSNASIEEIVYEILLKNYAVDDVIKKYIKSRYPRLLGIDVDISFNNFWEVRKDADKFIELFNSYEQHLVDKKVNVLFMKTILNSAYDDMIPKIINSKLISDYLFSKVVLPYAISRKEFVVDALDSNHKFNRVEVIKLMKHKMRDIIARSYVDFIGMYGNEFIKFILDLKNAKHEDLHELSLWIVEKSHENLKNGGSAFSEIKFNVTKFNATSKETVVGWYKNNFKKYEKWFVS